MASLAKQSQQSGGRCYDVSISIYVWLGLGDLSMLRIQFTSLECDSANTQPRLYGPELWILELLRVLDLTLFSIDRPAKVSPHRSCSWTVWRMAFQLCDGYCRRSRSSDSGLEDMDLAPRVQCPWFHIFLLHVSRCKPSTIIQDERALLLIQKAYRSNPGDRRFICQRCQFGR